MLTWENADLDFAGKCCIFVPTKEEVRNTWGFLLFFVLISGLRKSDF